MREIARVVKALIKTLSLFFILLGINGLLFDNDDNVWFIFVMTIMYGLSEMILIETKP